MEEEIRRPTLALRRRPVAEGMAWKPSRRRRVRASELHLWGLTRAALHRTHCEIYRREEIASERVVHQIYVTHFVLRMKSQ